MYRDLRGAARGADLDDLARAYEAAGTALEAGDSERGLRLLTWAKSVAPRSGAVREALGVGLYLHGDLAAAQRELLAYRRITGRADQNHLLADCARATGQDDKVADLVQEMIDGDVHEERVVEGLIVLAHARADRGDLRGGLAVLRRGGGPVVSDETEPWDVRRWYAAGDLAERLGETGSAREYFQAVVDVADDYLDAQERLDRLAT